ncbi:hypothetical protein [Brevundimonas sp.]|uniref:hypothetical protein n=1 Tax=Brevundimonas sp. TaxID=1871086 RepID=UPI00286C89F9|nr:hypothetical protein [Brevundimonas sp.]
MIRSAKIAVGVLLCGAFALLAAMIATTEARAEVVSRSADGFVLRFAVGVEAAPEDVVAAVSELPQWWAPGHTYTGDPANLSLAFEAGGCWCETLADGTVFEHAMVTRITADRVTMNAPLGPLHDKATKAELTFGSGPENRGRLVTIDFVVEGSGLGVMADGVNMVMDQAFDRLVHQIEYGEPPQP